MNLTETKALAKLPVHLREAIVRTVGLCSNGELNEIRLRRNKPLIVRVGGNGSLRDLRCTDLRCTDADIRHTVSALCDHSLYSHSGTIREGYICAGDGIRAGICGEAVLENGRMTVVRDITSVIIRIPHRVPGAADRIFDLIKEREYACNVLIYAKPGVGKTTVLRELAVRLSSGTHPVQTAVIDTRGEIAYGIDEAETLDILAGYPRSTGIETAVRTLSPQYILCDEIVTPEDGAAILSAAGAGVSVCATVHAGSAEILRTLPIYRQLEEVFDLVCGLLPTDGDKRYRLDLNECRTRRFSC